jgi:YVTN family beta-propeller protein
VAADHGYKTPVNLAIAPDGRMLFVVCEQSNSVVLIDTTLGRAVAEIAVGQRPHAAALSSDGAVLYVSNRFSGTVSVIDVLRRSVVGEIPVGAGPHGLRLSADGRQLFVLNTEEDTLSVIDTERRTEVRWLAAGNGPWSIAPGGDDATLVATSVRPRLAEFLEPHSSELTLIDAGRGQVRTRVLVPDANMMKGIAAVRSGPQRGMVLFALLRTKNLVPTTRIAQGWVITNGLGVLWPDGRVDQVLLDEPTAGFSDPADVAVAPDGRYAVVTAGGADQVAVVDLQRLADVLQEATPAEREAVIPNHLGLSRRFVTQRIAIGANPRGVAFAPDGRSVYVACALDDSVQVIDADTWRVTARIDLGGPGEISILRRGARVFHSAAISFGGQFSCQSCHPDGHVNGLGLDIEADGVGVKPVDNRTLRGILDTGPFKWEGTNPSLERQCGARLAVFFTRLAPYEPADLAALVRYMCTIERPPNPHRPAAGLTPAQLRGKLVFERRIGNDGRLIASEQRCSTCHSGPYKTSQARTIVRTTMWLDERTDLPPDARGRPDPRDFGDLGVFFFADAGVPAHWLDTPHLTNIYDSPPYLHNGAARTLEEIWTRFNYVEGHGQTRDLTRQQYNDLLAYLRAL